jgi:hypothetical protein
MAGPRYRGGLLATHRIALAGALVLLGCRRESPSSHEGGANASASSASPIARAPSPSPSPSPPGELVLEHLGDPQVLTADGNTLYWIDAQSRSLHAWSEADGGAPRLVTDSVAGIDDLILPFAVRAGVIHVLTRIDGEREPRVERMAASGGPRSVLSNGIKDLLGVAAVQGHVLVVLDVDPPQRSMRGEVFEVGTDRKLTTRGTTNGRPRAIVVSGGELFVAGSVGLSRHRAKGEGRTIPVVDFPGPGIAAFEGRVYYARTNAPVVASYGEDKHENPLPAFGVTLPAFAVAVQVREPAIYAGTRQSDVPEDAGSIERTIARALHEADETVKHRRRIRALFRVDRVDGKVTPIATFDPPATSFAITEHALYVASAARDGAIHRLPL